MRTARPSAVCPQPRVVVIVRSVRANRASQRRVPSAAGRRIVRACVLSTRVAAPSALSRGSSNRASVCPFHARLVRAATGMERRARRDSEECPDDFKCSITLEVMRDPVLLVSSGITYERSSLMEALERRPGVDPQTNAAFDGPPVVAANVTLKRAIEAWRSRPGRPAEEDSPPLTVL